MAIERGSGLRARSACRAISLLGPGPWQRRNRGGRAAASSTSRGAATTARAALHDVLRLDRIAAEDLHRLKSKIRMGTMDLKLATIALIDQATLYSANLRDFRQVPGLIVDDRLAES